MHIHFLMLIVFVLTAIAVGVALVLYAFKAPHLRKGPLRFWLDTAFFALLFALVLNSIGIKIGWSALTGILLGLLCAWFRPEQSEAATKQSEE